MHGFRTRSNLVVPPAPKHAAARQAREESEEA